MKEELKNIQLMLESLEADLIKLWRFICRK
jgi:hypothetical protein